MIKLKEIVNHFWLELSVLILVTITVLSLHPLEHLPEAPGSDKTHHLVAYAALAFPTALRKPKQWQVILIAFALYSGLIELVQPHVNRYWEWLDFLANISGLFIGMMLALATRWRLATTCVGLCMAARATPTWVQLHMADPCPGIS